MVALPNTHDYTLSAFYERLRAQVEHENDLYNNRMLWLVTLQAILFATMGFVIGGFFSEGFLMSPSGLLKNAVVLPVLVFVGMICAAGIYTAMACHRTLGQAAAVNDELDDLWRDQGRRIFELEQARLGEPGLSFDEAMIHFPHPRGGRSASTTEGRRSRSLPSGWFRSRHIPIVFVCIWSLSFIVTIVGIILVLSDVDPGTWFTG